MRAFGFVAALTAAFTVSPAFALGALEGAPDAKPRAEKIAPPSGKALRKVKSSKATKTAPRTAHSFAPDLAKRHHAIQHPKLVAPSHPADFGMKWNASTDRARDVRTQTIMNRTPSSGGKVGLKLPF